MKYLNELDLSKTDSYFLNVLDDALNSYAIPVMVIRGEEEGPLMAVGAALHGNEVTGIDVVLKLKDISIKRGTLLLLPVLNPMGLVLNERRFGVFDPNHFFDAKKNNAAGQFSTKLYEKVIKNVDIYIDLHTASDTRLNPLYTYHSMPESFTKHFDLDVFYFKAGSERTIRGQLEKNNKEVLTLEMGRSDTVNSSMNKDVLKGIKNLLIDKNMILDKYDAVRNRRNLHINKVSWIYSETTGFLSMKVKPLSEVKKGDILAVVYDFFGNVMETIVAPREGIVIGSQDSPINNRERRVCSIGYKED